jgi:hypothetical protein
MMRLFATIAAIAFVPISAVAQTDLPVTRLTVKAALAPNPVLRYELLPSFREKSMGNAAMSYHRAMLMLNEIYGGQSPKERSDNDIKIEEMMSKPRAELDVKAITEFIQQYSRAIREAEIAAQREQCDWDLERRMDVEGIGLLLPEIQKMRELARLINYRCRVHIAEGRFIEALNDVKTGMAMARHIGEGPTLIQTLVGLAVFQMFASCLDQILEMPDCPNLYWSLTALPRPFLDMRKSLEGEVRMMDASLPLLREIEKPMSTEQARKILDGWATSMQMFVSDPSDNYIKSRFVLAGLVAVRYPIARESLLKMGKTAAQLDAMPSAQVVLLESVLQYKSLRDEMFVWFHLPYSESRQGVEQVKQKLRQVRQEGVSDIFSAGLMSIIPAVDKVHFALVRAERRIAMLRSVEALRMQAAKNAAFPAKLSDVNIVPVPNDPVTGKPFEYELMKNGKAVIWAPAPLGEQPHAGNALKYELTLAK